MSDTRYCETCGRELVRFSYQAGFHYLTGKPRVETWEQCPKYGTLRAILTGGHTSQPVYGPYGPPPGLAPTRPR